MVLASQSLPNENFKESVNNMVTLVGNDKAKFLFNAWVGTLGKAAMTRQFIEQLFRK